MGYAIVFVVGCGVGYLLGPMIDKWVFALKEKTRKEGK